MRLFNRSAPVEPPVMSPAAATEAEINAELEAAHEAVAATNDKLTAARATLARLQEAKTEQLRAKSRGRDVTSTLTMTRAALVEAEEEIPFLEGLMEERQSAIEDLRARRRANEKDVAKVELDELEAAVVASKARAVTAMVQASKAAGDYTLAVVDLADARHRRYQHLLFTPADFGQGVYGNNPTNIATGADDGLSRVCVNLQEEVDAAVKVAGLTMFNPPFGGVLRGGMVMVAVAPHLDIDLDVPADALNILELQALLEKRGAP